LARLFQLDPSFRWLPLKEIKQLPRTERRNALLAKLEAAGTRTKVDVVVIQAMHVGAQ